MCEANVYFRDNGEEELIMESVDMMEPDGDDAWRLTDLFGEQKTVQGRVREMNLVDHRIFLERS
ncbi:conserved hypothetical protein [delta proteobacterium NaphS2]|nr:conserved hypothetical protein [delta proteobacterium NaphS2]